MKKRTERRPQRQKNRKPVPANKKIKVEIDLWTLIIGVAFGSLLAWLVGLVAFLILLAMGLKG